jgi:putative ABC transport system permease protein
MLGDLLYATRTLRKNRGFAIVAILTLALGIGANTAIFTVVNAVLLRPLPFQNPNSLCLLTERLRDIPQLNPSYQNWLDWKTPAQSFSGVAAAHIAPMTLTGVGEPERLQGQMATANLFPLLGVTSVRGHTFSPDEDKAGGPPVVLLGYGFWKSHFGGAENVLGRSITLDNQTYTITGILPSGYQLIQPADVIVPFEPWAKKLPDDRSWHPGIISVARLKPGVSLESAQAELKTIAKRLELQYPVYDTDVSANVTRLHEQLVQNVRPALLVLLGAVGLVLLIACTNVAGLSLARSNERRREIAVRTAMGAGRLRIARQLLTESVLLALAGGAAGLLVAVAGVPALVRLASNSVPDMGPVEVDYRVLLFAAGVVVLAGILFGLAPVVQSARLDLRSALNDASRGSTVGSGTTALRKLLVIGEIALALILLVGAGLLLRSFEQLQVTDPGFHPGHLLVADLPLSPQAHSKSPERMQFCDRLIQRAADLPGIVSVGAATNLPVSGGGSLARGLVESESERATAMLRMAAAQETPGVDGRFTSTSKPGHRNPGTIT